MRLCFSPFEQTSSAATRVWTGERTWVGTVLRWRHLYDMPVSVQSSDQSHVTISVIYLFALSAIIYSDLHTFDQMKIHICNDMMEVGVSYHSCQGVVSSTPCERTNVTKMFSQGEHTLIPNGDSFMSPKCVKKSDASWGGKLTVILISHSLKIRWCLRGHRPYDFNGNLMWMKVTDVECRKVPDRSGEHGLNRGWVQ